MRLFPAFALSIFLAFLALLVPAKAANPPFVEPPEWATICTDKQPALQPLVRGTNCRWLRLDGVWRRYIVYVPNNARFALDRSWPLTFMFHGTTGNGEKFWRISGWKELAERVGTVVVFPTSWRYKVIGWGNVTRWNSYTLPRQIDMSVRFDGYPATSPYPARDTLFISLMVADVQNALRINPKRRFASGFSNGADFITRVAVDLNRIFAAVSCQSLCTGALANANPSYRTSVLIGLGNIDPLWIQTVNDLFDPDITQFPMIWADADNYVQPVFNSLLTAMDLNRTPTTVSNGLTRSVVTWATPTPGNTAGNVVRFEMMKDVEHEYARLNNNPNHFYFAERSWGFFLTHPKP